MIVFKSATTTTTKLFFCENKMTEPVRIRMIDAAKDAEAVLQIYAHYIENTAITFETSVPGIAEFEQRICSICSRFPFLVCTLNGTIVGYAYADVQRERAAYQWNTELSVYVKNGWTGREFGRALCGATLDILKRQNIQNVYSGIALPNAASEKLHEHLGFTLVGVYREAGYKFGQWHSVAWYEKFLGDHNFAPIPVVPIQQIPVAIIGGIIKTYETGLERGSS